MSEFDSIIDIQKNMASRIVRENSIDKSLKLLEIIQSLINSKGRVQKEAIIIEATYNGFLVSETEVLIKDLVRNRSLSEDGSEIVLF